MPTFSTNKAKIQLKLSVQRTRLTIQKKEALAKKARRDIASLIEKGKLETGRLRVEQIIAEDSAIELLELLELYCELLLARIGLLDIAGPCDPLIEEAVVGIIHAAPRTEISELQPLRELLILRYGREFAVAAAENKEGVVSTRVTNKLKVGVPDPELVDLYMYEVAQAYEVDWKPDSVIRQEKEAAEKEAAEKKSQIPTAPDDWTKVAQSHTSPANLPPSQRAPATPPAMRIDLPPGSDDDARLRGLDLPSTPPTSSQFGVTISTNLRASTSPSAQLPSVPQGFSAPAPKPAEPAPASGSGNDLNSLAARLAALKKG